MAKSAKKRAMKARRPKLRLATPPPAKAATTVPAPGDGYRVFPRHEIDREVCGKCTHLAPEEGDFTLGFRRCLGRRVNAVRGVCDAFKEKP